MNLRRGPREEPDINLTPLIDVVFNILLFFMVSTTFITQSNLRIVLPDASPAAQAPDSEVMELAIDAEGQYFLDGKALLNRQPITIRRALERLVGEGDRRPLVIRADASTVHQAVVTAMDAAGQAGIKQLSIATVPDDEAR